MSALPLKADMCSAQATFTGADKRHREPHCIAGKLNAWPSSGIREYCPDPRQRLGKDALRLYRTRAQYCSPMQHILGRGFLAPFGDTRACCLLALAPRCTAFSVLGRKLTPPLCLFCFALERRSEE